MKTVSIGVGGRFHSDFMYEALVRLGYSAHVLTSLPKNRFSLPHKAIQNCIWPEVIFRIARNIGLESSGDALKMKYFGRFLSNTLSKLKPDLFIGWSSFSLESFQKRSAKTHILMRDSAHINFQYQLLSEEYEKFGFSFPNRKICLQRELEEYSLADRIWVLSEFAKKTFIDQGVKAEKMGVLPLGVDLDRFYPADPSSEPLPLKIIYFGSLSFRKGIQYLLEGTKSFSPKQIELKLIGAVEPDFKSTLSKYTHFSYQKALTQSELAIEIRKHHVFVFPTLEDGFGQTLIQAMASGLVPITTTHCGSADFTSIDKGGRRLEPRSSSQIQAKLEMLLSCSSDDIQEMRSQAILEARELTWSRYERQLASLIASL